MATQHLGAPDGETTGRRGFGVPWWYRFVRSWRARMWIETGIWLADTASSNGRHSLLPPPRV